MSVYWSGLIQEGVTTQILDEIERESEQRRSHSFRERQKKERKKSIPVYWRTWKSQSCFSAVTDTLPWPRPPVMTQNDPALIIEPKAELVWHRWYKRFFYGSALASAIGLLSVMYGKGERDRERCLACSLVPFPSLFVFLSLIIIVFSSACSSFTTSASSYDHYWYEYSYQYYSY